MAEAKPFASLSSSLLARKGSAKPAMRPQGWGQGMGLEDLGWNDMGLGQQPAPVQHRPEHVPSPITALTPAPRAVPVEPATPPAVVEQQRAIEASFAEPAAVPALAVRTDPAPVKVQAIPPVVEAPAQAETPAAVGLPKRPRRAPGSKDKAAFTLRLAADRHLKLRLACAVTHRSAQQIVTDALDAFLQGLPEVEAMAGQVPANTGKH
jgi:hypothetical protein